MNGIVTQHFNHFTSFRKTHQYGSWTVMLSPSLLTSFVCSNAIYTSRVWVPSIINWWMQLAGIELVPCQPLEWANFLFLPLSIVLDYFGKTNKHIASSGFWLKLSGKTIRVEKKYFRFNYVSKPLECQTTRDREEKNVNENEDEDEEEKLASIDC